MTDHTVPAAPIPVRLSGQLAQKFGSSGTQPADIFIDGIPFRLHPDSYNPFVRDWPGYDKEQFDTSSEAGENSFGTWWLRSQATFHGGAGQRYLDSSDPTIGRTRFYTSRYAFPHRAGELTIAGALTAPGATDKGSIEQVTWSGVQKAAFSSTALNQVVVYDLPGLTAPQTITLGTSGVPAAMTSDGVNLYVAITDSVWRITPGGVATKTHTLTFTGPVRMAFAKQRLIVTTGNKVYQLDPNPATPPVAVGAPLYTNPSTNYVYSAIAEGPNGIYLAGAAGPLSDLSSMSVTDSSGTVVLGTPIVQLRFPPGEVCNAVFFYVGTFFALATSNGVRIGQFSIYGQAQMGPLLFDQPRACYSLTGSGTLIYVGAKDSIWWVDLSTPIDRNGTMFAYSMYADGIGDVNDMTVVPGAPDLVYATTATGGTVYQTSFSPSRPATITTSWSRFGTVEPKQLYYVRVDGNFPKVAGVQYVATVTAECDTGETVTFNIEGGDSSYEFATTALPVSQSFRLTITLADSGSGHGVMLRSWQLKALPAPRVFGEFTLPLACHDSETARDGGQYGYDQFARDRLLALEALRVTNQEVTVVDKITNTSYEAVIRRVQYRQESAPTDANTLGGLINVVLRLV